MTRLTHALFVALIPLSFASAEDASTPSLAKKLEAVMDGPDYKRAHWGALVVDAKTGEPVYSRQPDKLFAPASVTKLFTTAAALVTFGVDHTFQTPVYARGETVKGVLRGDLILVASGDPSFGGRTNKDGKLAFTKGDHTYANSGLTDTVLTDTNPLTAFDDLAKQVKEVGVNEVTGEVLIDDRLFVRSRSTGSGPEIVSPIMVNDNVIDVIVTPAAEKGAPAKVTTRPETKVVTLDADVDTTGKLEPPYILMTQATPGHFVVRGRVPVGKPVVRILPVEDPTLFARSLFVEALRRAGVKVTAAVARPEAVSLPAVADYAIGTAVAVHKSAPLGEALKVTLKVSHNLYASTLPCLVAVKNGKTTMEDGLRIERRILKELGVDVDAVSFGGGAGGSAADYATPKATVQLLQGLAKRKDWPQFRDWLPVLGEDGTLSEAVEKSSPAKGQVFAKTGTYVWTDALNGRMLLKSKALAGAMTTKSGRELHFALFVNDVPLPPGGTAARVGKVLGHLCEIVYEECK